MDYTSNTEDIHMYVEASRAIDSMEMVMMAENLPRTFRVSPTDDWGVEIASSGKERITYIKFSNSPSAPGVTRNRNHWRKPQRCNCPYHLDCW